MPDPQLGPQDTPQPAGAAPVVSTPEGAAPTKPDGQQVPLAALQGEQANTKQARDEAAKYRAALELHGFQFNADGTILGPQPASGYVPPTYQPPQAGGAGISPGVMRLAGTMGVDPTELQTAFDERVMAMGTAIVGPMGEGISALSEQVLRTNDPYFPVYEEEFHTVLKTAPAHLRGSPEVIKYARDIARGRKTDAIAQRMVESQGANPQEVGRFTERVAPGAGGRPASLPPETNALADQFGLTPEQKARVADRRARRGEG